MAPPETPHTMYEARAEYIHRDHCKRARRKRGSGGRACDPNEAQEAEKNNSPGYVGMVPAHGAGGQGYPEVFLLLKEARQHPSLVRGLHSAHWMNEVDRRCQRHEAGELWRVTGEVAAGL